LRANTNWRSYFFVFGVLLLLGIFICKNAGEFKKDVKNVKKQGLEFFNKVKLFITSTPCPEKSATLFLPVTPRNSNRFSKFFYHHALH